MPNFAEHNMPENNYWQPGSRVLERAELNLPGFGPGGQRTAKAG